MDEDNSALASICSIEHAFFPTINLGLEVGRRLARDDNHGPAVCASSQWTLEIYYSMYILLHRRINIVRTIISKYGHISLL